jgi:hypothetical protein
MDGLTIIILAILVLLFGKNFLSLTLPTTPVITNAVPTPDGIPAMTTQNNSPTGGQQPSSQPPPWSNVCNPPSPSLPMTPIQTSIQQAGNNVRFPVKQRVTFTQ